MDNRIETEFDEVAVARMMEDRWRNDAAEILRFAGALLVSGTADTVESAVEAAQVAWFSLLADGALGQRAVSAPSSQAVAALRLQLPSDRSAP